MMAMASRATTNSTGWVPSWAACAYSSAFIFTRSVCQVGCAVNQGCDSGARAAAADRDADRLGVCLVLFGPGKRQIDHGV